MVFSDLVKAEWPIHTQEASLALGIAEPPLHGRHTPCDAAQTTTSCCAHPCHAARSRSMTGVPVERAGLEVAGFRDYARNDEVEDPTLCGEACHAARSRSIQKGL